MSTEDSINEVINAYGNWRTDRLKELRSLINKTEPKLTEEFKWGVPVWTLNGLVCGISGFKDHVKINFFKGAKLADPKGLFNSGLKSKDHRSINMAEDDKLDSDGIAELVKTAVALNQK